MAVVTAPVGTTVDVAAVERARRGGVKPMRVLLYVVLTVLALGWLLPIGTAVYSSFRYFEADTQVNGVFSWPESLTLENYRDAWNVGEIGSHFLKTAFIVLPALVLILLLASCVAFACTRYSWKFNIFFLMLFTAGNLMPVQVIFQPLFQIYKRVPLPDFLSDTDTGNLLGTKIAVILIHVAFQVGFCTFVLSNYMKTIPTSLNEAARVDGAGVVRQFFGIILPLCKPALAALATLEFTWIYNDFLYAVVLMSTGDKLPITSALNNLRGQFFTDYNLLAAGSVVVALPTVLVFLLLQRHFIAGLTLGANKG
jgi:multiple sugar transport system permease protein